MVKILTQYAVANGIKLDCNNWESIKATFEKYKMDCAKKN